MRNTHAALALAATVAALSACSKKERKDSADQTGVKSAAQPVDIRDPKTCAACHPKIAAEYGGSMHARAHHSQDPIYNGVREIRRKKEGEEILATCASCHTPGFEATPEAPEAVVGVACFTCHNVRVGAPEGALLGPNAIAAAATTAHGTGDAGDAFKDGTTLCMGCHASLETAAGLSMCATGAEHEATAAEDRRRCVDCHMPKVAGAATVMTGGDLHSSHAFLGPHAAWYRDDPAFLQSAFSLSSTWSGKDLAITIANQSGHALPTGFPGRQMWIACEGKDASGAVAWTCDATTLGKKYVDADGKPTLPPYAARLEADSRLKPGERRELAHAVPAEVESIEVIVGMRLMPEMLATKLKLLEATEAEDRILSRQTVERTP